ncbi:hypothetical protein H8Z75_23700 (plasmid) [Xanthomonas citri pv. citri]|nr:hypothetical protein H8Z75_23700 [Xanthomonas citri pv. citri]
MTKIIPPALLAVLLAAPAAAMATEPASLSEVLECNVAADKALVALERAGIPITGQSVPVSNVAAYGVPVKRIDHISKNDEFLQVTFVIDRSGHGKLVAAAGLKAWDDEFGAGFRSAMLGGKNELNVTHPDDPNAEDNEVLGFCMMSFRGAL